MTIADRQTTIFDYILMSGDKAMLVIILHSGVALTPKFENRKAAEKVIEDIRTSDDTSIRVEHLQGHFYLVPGHIKEAYIM